MTSLLARQFWPAEVQDGRSGAAMVGVLKLPVGTRRRHKVEVVRLDDPGAGDRAAVMAERAVAVDAERDGELPIALTGHLHNPRSSATSSIPTSCR